MSGLQPQRASTAARRLSGGRENGPALSAHVERVRGAHRAQCASERERAAHPATLPQLTMSFIHEDFLLSNQTAKRLYHTFAENEPILDYHCHLPPKDIAENRQFRNLFEIWLEGDHYKWRA